MAEREKVELTNEVVGLWEQLATFDKNLKVKLEKLVSQTHACY